MWPWIDEEDEDEVEETQDDDEGGDEDDADESGDGGEPEPDEGLFERVEAAFRKERATIRAAKDIGDLNEMRIKGEDAPVPAPARAPARPAETSATSAAVDPKAQPSALVNEFSEADKLALASVGCWPPTPVERRGAFWMRDADWPAEWTLTGGDLGRFRGEIHLTRSVFAAQLGVDSALLRDAELSPREKVRPALQLALRRAMDVVREQRRRERDDRTARAEAASTPALTVAAGGWAAQPAASAQALTMPATTVAAAKPVAAFTGADINRLRTERGLSQRELAALMGVGHGMVGKAELVPTKPLGERMQAAFARGAPPGGAPR